MGQVIYRQIKSNILIDHIALLESTHYTLHGMAVGMLLVRHNDTIGERWALSMKISIHAEEMYY